MPRRRHLCLCLSRSVDLLSFCCALEGRQAETQSVCFPLVKVEQRTLCCNVAGQCMDSQNVHVMPGVAYAYQGDPVSVPYRCQAV